MFLDRLSDKGIKESGHWDNLGISLPNCTTYVLGEYLEQGGTKKQLFKDRKVMGYPNAKNFYSDWLGDKGTAPKVGGFAVWGSSSAQYGHTAYIYDVKARDGGWDIKVSQSNYGGAFFELQTYYVKAGAKTAGVGFPYLGCCYNQVDDKRTARNKEKNQVEVIATNLQARKLPNGEKLAGLFIPQGIYNYSEIVHEGEYDWCHVDNVWFALKEDEWTYLYPADIEAERLRAELTQIKNDNMKLQSDLNTANKKIKTLNSSLSAIKQYIELIGGILK